MTSASKPPPDAPRSGSASRTIDTRGQCFGLAPAKDRTAASPSCCSALAEGGPRTGPAAACTEEARTGTRQRRLRPMVQPACRKRADRTGPTAARRPRPPPPIRPSRRDQADSGRCSPRPSVRGIPTTVPRRRRRRTVGAVARIRCVGSSTRAGSSGGATRPLRRLCGRQIEVSRRADQGVPAPGTRHNGGGPVQSGTADEGTCAAITVQGS